MTARTAAARLVVVAPPELAAGFRLAGVETQVVTDPVEAAALLQRLTAEGERGVVAVYEPYLAALPESRRRLLESSIAPVVVALPSGTAAAGAAGRRALLVSRLQQAVGYRITFGGEGS